MRLADGLAAVEVGDGAGDPQHAVIAAGAEMAAAALARRSRAAAGSSQAATRSSSSPSASLLVRSAGTPGLGEALGLQRPRGGDPGGDLGRALARRRQRHVGDG